MVDLFELFNVVYMLRCSLFFFFKQKTEYDMRISDWSSDVCSSDLDRPGRLGDRGAEAQGDRLAAAGDGLGVVGPAEQLDEGGGGARREEQHQEIGRASCMERVSQYV